MITPYTASLEYRCRVKHAVTYIQFLNETDPITLVLWQGDYKTGDIKQWARERINNILIKASELVPLFVDDAELVKDVRGAARDAVEMLRRDGFKAPGGEIGY